jgi:cyclohexa-1,5-dienecarbonyl-CoA hydratase
LLPARVGAARASEAILGGLSKPAAEWREAGLVAFTAPDADLHQAVEAWFARALARYSAESLRHAVRAARAPVVAALERDLAEAERLYLTELMATHDANEGVRAFLDKRPPRWKDE